MATDSASQSGRIFSDNEVTARVLDVIRNAESWVALVSPYVDRVGHVEQALLQAKRRGVRILIVVRRDEDAFGGNNGKEALAWFDQEGLEVKAVPNLHAKFYANEREGVITSMNLLRSSWSGSLELGMSVTADDHRQLVSYLRDHLTSFFTVTAGGNSETVSEGNAAANKTKAKTTKTPKRYASAGRKPQAQVVRERRSGSFTDMLKNLILGAPGYCIRCGKPLAEGEADSGKVLCQDDYTAWAVYRNPEFPEKYCTTCGKRRRTTYSRPECSACYRR